MLWSKAENKSLLEWQALKSQDFEIFLLSHADQISSEAEQNKIIKIQ